MSSSQSRSRDIYPAPANPPLDFHFEYDIMKGCFMQSEEDTDDGVFDFKSQNFGLINRNYPTDNSKDKTNNTPPWPRFAKYMRHLNSSTDPSQNTHYKVLFLGRHGQGHHNVGESKYGTAAWDAHYSLLDGYDGLTWSDAHLTPLGEQQAREVHALWQEQLAKGLPLPETCYVSPLARTLQTGELTFRGLEGLGQGWEYRPVVKEMLRECIGMHTCDRRSGKAWIEANYPYVRLEEGFDGGEGDWLYLADYREPRASLGYRVATLLDDVFAHDDGVFLSLTSHSGAIRAMLEVLGHRVFGLETGGVIAVCVKAQRVGGKRERPRFEESEGPPAVGAK